jgi:hypothetical protein
MKRGRNASEVGYQEREMPGENFKKEMGVVNSRRSGQMRIEKTWLIGI